MLFAAEVRIRARAQEALLAARGAAVSAAAALVGPEPVAEHQLRQLQPQHQLRQRGRPQLRPGAASQQKVEFLNLNINVLQSHKFRSALTCSFHLKLGHFSTNIFTDSLFCQWTSPNLKSRYLHLHGFLKV